MTWAESVWVLIIVFIILVWYKSRKVESFSKVSKPQVADNFSVSGLKSEDFNVQTASHEFYMPVGTIVALPWDPKETQTTKSTTPATIASTKTYTPTGSTTLQKLKSINPGGYKQAIGSIICTILPLGEDEIHVFPYNGYLLFPMGHAQNYSFTKDTMPQLWDAMTIGQKQLIPSMLNKSMFYSTDTAAKTSDAITRELTVGSVTGVAKVTDEEGSVIQTPKTTDTKITVDIRDKGNLVFMYLIVGYAD